MSLKMNPRSILSIDLSGDIDSTILLGLEKMKLVSQLDVESVLSEGEAKDLENQDSQDSNSESDAEEPTPGTELKENKDINGNEETSSDNNLNGLFSDLNLSSSDNEEERKEPSPRLRERGGPDRNPPINQNRNSVYENSEKYYRSRIDPRQLHLSGSSIVQSSNYNISLENNQASALDSSKSSVGSPESGYESLSSPPPIVPATFIDPKLECIKDDQNLVNYIINTEVCALTHPKQLIDFGDKEKIINSLVDYLQNTEGELVEVASSNTNIDSELVEVASPHANTDIVPQAKNSEDSVAIHQPLISKDVAMPVNIAYKLKEEAKGELRKILSNEKLRAAEYKIFKRLREDKEKNQEERPVKVIQVVDEDIRTNLHHSVLDRNLEEMFCLVQIQKNYLLGFSDLNIRDKDGKTALDYAIQQEMDPLVIEYLKENNACRSVNV